MDTRIDKFYKFAFGVDSESRKTLNRGDSQCRFY